MKTEEIKKMEADTYRREIAKQVLPIIIDMDRDYLGKWNERFVRPHCVLAKMYADILTNEMYESN